MGMALLDMNKTKRIDTLQQFLTDRIDRQGVKQKEIADAIGKSHTYIWNFRKTGQASEEVLTALEKYMYDTIGPQPATLEVAATKRADFVKTKDASNILGLCVATETMNGIGAVLGNAGTGKTHALKEYASRNDKAVFIRANGMMSRSGLLKAIAKAVGATPAGRGEEMLEDIIETLRETPRVLIIDEIEQLMPAKNITKIEILRTIHDETKDYGNSLIMAGPVWVEQKLKKRTIGENYGQIDSRIDYLYKTEGLSRDEILSILQDYDMNDAAKSQIVSLITRTSKGGIRWLSKLLQKCLDDASVGSGLITAETVKNATAMMML
ncbi:ATP-binding protein [Paenibacillus sp. M1]|uniref:ATP-binding protein n=1 Tax=Paenibacillus haidiansis TaxID=1574488 RepID=A0ABU7VQT4_9BACL